MRRRLRHLGGRLLAPALDWFRGQLGALDARIGTVQDRVEQLDRTNRSALDVQEATTEAVGRMLARQRDLLESLEAQQAQLVDEVAALRDALEGAGRGDLVAPAAGADD